jgi:hypothetical protein
MTVLVAVAGWVGAVLVLVAYVLLSTRRIDGHSTTYHVMNLLGAACIAANSGWNGAIPSAVVNVIWIGIAIYALSRPSIIEPDVGGH